MRVHKSFIENQTRNKSLAADFCSRLAYCQGGGICKVLPEIIAAKEDACCYFGTDDDASKLINYDKSFSNSLLF